MPALPLTHPPLKLTAPKLTDEPAGKTQGAEHAKGATKPESSAKPAKDGAAAPGEKPAKRRKKAPAAGGDTSAAPPPAPAAAPPPAE